MVDIADSEADPEVGGPTVSLAEAADRSELSLATIRRRLKAGSIPGAARNADRSWSIPAASLVAEGIWSSTTPADDPAAEAEDQGDEVAELRASLQAERHRAELAEQRADLLAQSLEDMRTSMRMLEAAPPPPRLSWRERRAQRRQAISESDQTSDQ